MRTEWGNIRNIRITMSGTKWPSSKHDSFLCSPKGLPTYMMFLSLHGMAVIILRATVTSGKHILNLWVMFTAVGLLSVSLSLSPAVPLQAKRNVVKPSSTLISWRLQPLWGCWSLLCRVTHLLCPQACWRRLLKSVYNTCCHLPRAPASGPGHAPRTWVNLEPWGSTVWNQHTNGSFLHIWKPEKVALEYLSIASHYWERNRKSSASSTFLIVQSGWAMCKISHNAIPCHPENVTLLRCSYPVRRWEMGFLSLSRTQKIRCFPGATNVNFMLGFWF